MLESLQINNLALVESLRFEPAVGLNMITGETGAGKSIIVGALNVVLGERVDKTLVRDGVDQCAVEAVFHLASPAPVNTALETCGLPPCQDGMLIIRRTVPVSGSGRQFVNDSPVTLQTLRAIGQHLVDMHGPHDHQSLLDTDFQLDLLDAFGRLESLCELYQTAYRAWQSLKAQRAELSQDTLSTAQQIEFLEYQIAELDAAELREDEELSVEREQAILGNAQRIIQLSETVRIALLEGEASAFNSLAVAQQNFGELAALVESAVAWRADAKAIAVQIQELFRTVTSFVQNMEADPARLQWLDERLALYQKMKRKYGGTVGEILKTLAVSRERLHDLKTRDAQLQQLDRSICAAAEQLTQAGETLRAKRLKATDKLAKAIAGELADLGFKQSEFAVNLSASPEPRPSGLDQIEFMFSPNAGESLKPLKLIASSGEISRVMLAVKAALAVQDRIPVLVFDEIDANIGGTTANAVGAKLAEVARQHQILCITHLPQVAVYGAVQFAVTKDVRGGRTLTSIRKVDGAEREDEVARMLGGRDMTDVTLTHAREMIRQANGAPARAARPKQRPA